MFAPKFNKDVLSKLKKLTNGVCDNVIDTYGLLCEIPRGSGNMDGITKQMLALGKASGLEVMLDKPSGDVIMRKKADKGFEKVPSICFQGHMDMVCVKTEDSKHNFLTDPLVLQLTDDGWLKATKTTLGSDNGIGVALGFEMLTNKTFKTGPLELLLTTNEETDFSGVNFLSTDVLQSELLINIDSEELGYITVGSAGGIQAAVEYTFTDKDTTVSKDTDVAININLLQASGGHSGVQIDLYRANTIKLIARMLYKAAKDLDSVKLVSFNGGQASNAIPPATAVRLVGNASDIKTLSGIADEMAGIFKKEYKSTDPKLSFTSTIEDLKVATPVFSRDFTLRTIKMLHAIPDGVIRMDTDLPEQMVETSLNTGMVQIEVPSKAAPKGRFTWDNLMRSSKKTALGALFSSIEALTEMAGFELKNKTPVTLWEPNLDSQLLVRIKAAMDKYLAATVDERKTHPMYKKAKSTVFTIHAGLECGEIVAKYPKMDAVSIGPTIINPHTYSEALYYSDVPIYYNLIKEFVEDFAKQSK